MKVTRAQASWNYIYIMLGFALSIEGSIIQMIDVIRFPVNVIAFLLIAGVTAYIFLFSGRFQNKLIGWRRYEDEPRAPH